MENAIETRKQSELERVEAPETVSPRVDILENDDEFLVLADLPGVASEAVAISLDRASLGLEAVTRDGARRYRRSFRVPDELDADAIQARMENGVLSLSLPKSDDVKPRRIAVRSA